MAAQHTRDHFPNICAAGRPYRDNESVAQCLQVYPLEDKVNAIKHEVNVWDKKEPPLYKAEPLENHRNCGIYTKVYHRLRHPVKTRYQTLIGDLQETTHPSYWDWEPGKKRDSTGQLPLSVHPYATTFGDPSVRDSTVKELVNPDKHYGQVYDEYIKGHENYRKSHNDYFPKEQKDRNYLKPAFNPDQRFGALAGYDPRGIWMKCIMTTDTNDFAVVNDIKTEYQNRFGTKLAECKTPDRNIDRVPANYRFGVKGSDITIAEIFDENLPIKDFTCWIPLETAYEVCDFYNVFFYKHLMTDFLYLMNIAKNGWVNYQKFVDVLNWKAKFPSVDVWYVPIDYCYETSSEAALKDCKMIDNTCLPAAGIPSRRHDIPYPVTPPGGSRVDIKSLGPETDATILISPTIFCQYGLNFYDFFRPRPKETIRTIFKNIGYEFDDNEFNEIWCKALVCDQTGDVCVNTFNELVKQLPKKE